MTDDVYDIHSDIQVATCKKIPNTTYLGFEIAKHPQILDNVEIFKIRQMLNNEQHAIVKDMVMKKIKHNKTSIHLFLTGGAGTSKTFTTKVIYQALLHIYNNTINNPDKPKGILTNYIGRVAYNIGGVTIHSTFHIPFNKLEFLPLNSDTTDKMSKH